MSYLLNQDTIQKQLELGVPAPLDSELEIEDCIAALSDADEKIDFLKRLKADRVDKIDTEIQKHTSRREFIRQIILKTLESKDIRSLDFPGVGRVSWRRSKGKWLIDDEEKLFDELIGRLKPAELEEVVKTSKTIVKSQLNKYLMKWEKLNEVPDSVTREKETSNLAVTMHESFKNRQVVSKDIAANNDEETVDSTKGLADLDKLPF